MAEFRINPAKKKLDAGGVVTLVMGDYSPDMVEFLGQFGFDAIMGEMEHGTTSWRDIADLSRACDLWNMMAMVRINRNDPALITRTLDCGANGIMVPHVNTADEARLVATSALYGPVGNRGQFGGRRSFGVADYHRLANENVMTAILIEDIAAVENLEPMLEVDGIDVFYVAPGDLAQSMGHTGNIGHPDVQETVDRAIAQIVRAGRVAGALVNDANVERTLDQGVRMIGTSWTNWIAAGAQGFLQKVAATTR
jgi:4-hydroxy-2-oxoheptanedioate aldolase